MKVITKRREKKFRGEKMNKTLTSMLTIGAGIAAYNYLQKNNVISNRNMRKLKKGMKAIF